MKIRHPHRRNPLRRHLCLPLASLMLMLGAVALAPAQTPPATAASTPHAWTMESAIQQLQLYPRDPYLQYVVLQLNQREGNAYDAEALLRQTMGRGRRGNANIANVDLFSIFSGALAVQESLQLDAMTEGTPPDLNTPKGTIKDLTGPTVKSHPWTEMLAGRQPSISPLARCVPADHLFVQFESVGSFLQAMQLADHWGAYVVSQTRQESRSLSVTARLKRQLAVETTDLLQPIYDRVVGRLAITSSDMFFREGTDVTLLMELSQPQLFRLQMDQFLTAAEQNESGAVRSEGVIQGVPYVHVTTPERIVHVYSAYPRPNLHVRSNSRLALERVLAAILGKTADGQPVTRLGDTDEFAFIRTIMEEGAAEEDGFVYMSDAFIRNLVGPQAKLTQRRRILCYNHLRMIGHASLMYTTERGRQAESLQQLIDARCLPESFGEGRLTCQHGGRYALAADGLSGVCSHHGRANSLVPCCEIPIEDITESEAKEYQMFVDRYNQYWRTFFDPIAIRLQLTPQKYRIETVVLPLIDNSIYTNLASVLGGTPEPLDAFPLPKRNIFTLGMKLDKAELIRKAGLAELLTAPPPAAPADTTPETVSRHHAFQMVGLAMHNFHDAYRSFPPPALPANQKKSALSWRVHLLPFLDHQELYEQFHLDEPWDSEHNRPLISQMPPIFRSPNSRLSSEGKTTLVFPQHPQAIHAGDRGARLADIRDGTSNTILLVEVDDKHAVTWTKPDDLQLDLQRPAFGWRRTPAGTYTVLLADGSVAELPATTGNPELAALLTRAGGERTIDLDAFRPNFERGRRVDEGELEFVRRLHLVPFLTQGIGNQISLNICDADPLVDFNVSRFLGMMVGSFRGGGGRFNLFDEEGVIALLALSLNVPIYVAVPVTDAEVVDRTLAGLDAYLATVARQEFSGLGDFFEIRQDFYQLQHASEHAVRSYAFRFGPLTWRFFWARIGQGLYVASKPFIIEDLLALENARHENPQAALTHHAGPPAHGLLRVRPTNWDQVLTQYRIGWSENQRLACLHNVGPLSSLSRAVHARPNETGSLESQLEDLTFRVFDAHFFCPANGKYVLAADGNSVSCTVHGSAQMPRQPPAPGADTRLGALLNELTDVSLALTFLEDGLHAVVTIEKK